MPYGDHLAIRPCQVEPSLRPLQAAAERLIVAIRATEKAKKGLLEIIKDLKMYELKGHGQDKMKARRDWLETNYVPELRKIGITRAELTKRLGKSVIVGGDAITTLQGEKLFDLFEGDAAFERVDTGEALERTVYRKKGVLQQGSIGEKHYIQDDEGNFTRRFAYVEKPWDAFKIMLINRELIGKDVATRLGGDPYSKGEMAKAKYDYPETGGDGPMSRREMVFVNQEDGSSVQRGLAITSTTKAIHGNQGFRFGNPDGVNMKIDLALIPLDESNLLLNLHSFEAQQETIGLMTYELNGRKRAIDKLTGLPKVKGTAAESKLHTDRSTSKNREVVILKLPLYAIRAVIFHNPLRAAVFGDLVRERITECGATHNAEVIYAPHSSISPEELFEQ